MQSLDSNSRLFGKHPCGFYQFWLPGRTKCSPILKIRATQLGAVLTERELCVLAVSVSALMDKEETIVIQVDGALERGYSFVGPTRRCRVILQRICRLARYYLKMQMVYQHVIIYV